MDRSPACLDFAVIGHQDSWENVAAFVNCIRGPGYEPLDTDRIRGIFPFIPPTDLFSVSVNSVFGRQIKGVYIETFIDPGKLDRAFNRSNLQKVGTAAAKAKKLGAKIVTLGGFTSIVSEGNLADYTSESQHFTTGNTLTAAYIVKGVEHAAALRGVELKKATVLVIGATGDIGLACTRYFKHVAGSLALCARNKHRLQQLAAELASEGISTEHSTCISDLAPKADVIISVTSSSGLDIGTTRPHVLICDAGYPKNLDARADPSVGRNVFHGGMGQVRAGFRFSPDYSGSIYRYPAAGIIHGCILEAMVLAFEGRYENYSSGKGNITPQRMNEIYGWSLQHGICLAPLYNAEGLWISN